MSMIIPEPILKTKIDDLHGLSWWEQFKYTCKNPPRLEVYEHYFIQLGNGIVIAIPKGFLTDLASVPRPLWAMPGFSPLGPLRYGAIPHDFAYQYGYLLAVNNGQIEFNSVANKLMEKYPKKFIELIPVFAGKPQDFFDKLLKDITIEKTGAKFVGNVAYLALGRYGHNAWDKYRLQGPSAYNDNSIGYPGLLQLGVK